MSDLVGKLAIKSGFKVCLVDPTSGAEWAIRQVSQDGISFSNSLAGMRYNVIPFWLKELEDAKVIFANVQGFL